MPFAAPTTTHNTGRYPTRYFVLYLPHHHRAPQSTSPPVHQHTVHSPRTGGGQLLPTSSATPSSHPPSHLETPSIHLAHAHVHVHATSIPLAACSFPCHPPVAVSRRPLRPTCSASVRITAYIPYILQYLTVDGRYAHCAATTRSFELALDEGCLGRPDPHPGIRAGRREPCACTNSKWNRNFLAGPCTVDRNKYFPGDAPQTFCLCALTTLSPPPPVSLLLVASRLSPCLVVICTPKRGTSLLQT